MHRYIRILRKNIYFFIFIVLLCFFMTNNFNFKNDDSSNKTTNKVKIDISQQKKHTLKLDSINLNKTNFKVLKKINGIGSSKAAKIIEYRQNHGRIYNMKELLNVNGIGEKLLSKIDKYCYVKFK